MAKTQNWRRIAPAAILAVVTLCLGQASTAGAAYTRPTGKLAPATGALIGSYVRPAAWDFASYQTAITNRERDMGRKYDVTNWYYRFDEAFPSKRETWNAAEGRHSMVSWKAGYSSTINSGGADPIIRARADAVKALGKQTFIRYGWEMDSPHINGQYAGSPAEFVSAWKRIVNTFRSRGATNAVFVWCPTAWGFNTGRALPYYPGDAYVDWICADGYNWYGSGAQPTSPDRTFKQVHTAFYNWAVLRNKPLMVGETGAIDVAPIGKKAKWVADAQYDLKTSFPSIMAVVWFDTKHGTEDWRVNTSTSAYDAWKTMARDPYFRPAH